VLALGFVTVAFEHGWNVMSLPDELTEMTWRTKLKARLLGYRRLKDAYVMDTVSIRVILSRVRGQTFSTTSFR
jgi:hypothetical protein